ncbi:hypothetical protein CC80DRAFT_547090 [Byssothecium circinans]|uniref:Uncharacterized protein n=1 Tax=Byssothecium circinans TaxID=147558 RepID=A0A6A5UA84_9PLEO|nr:hypothetical protein CC80DRAFT_547090 [Byssothecium circinans]
MGKLTDKFKRTLYLKSKTKTTDKDDTSDQDATTHVDAAIMPPNTARLTQGSIIKPAQAPTTGSLKHSTTTDRPEQSTTAHTPVHPALDSDTTLPSTPDTSPEHPTNTTTIPTSHRARMNHWLSALPQEPRDYLPASTAPVLTPTHHHSTLHWLSTTAHTLLTTLDSHEHTYRTHGLRYHALPHAYRHGFSLTTNTHPYPHPHAARPRPNAVLLRRLAVVFECQGSRDSVDIFQDWRNMSKYLNRAKRRAEKYQQVRDMKKLVLGVRDVELDVARGGVLGGEVERILGSLGRVLDAVCEGAPTTEGAGNEVDLRREGGVQGSLLRGWVATFPEVRGDRALVDEVVGRVLEVEVERGTWWSEGV